MRIRIGALGAIAALAIGLLVTSADAVRRPAQPNVGTVACGTADGEGVVAGTVTWSPERLWPPNHKVRTITISYDTTNDDGDTLALTVDSITHNEEGIERGAAAKARVKPDYPDLATTPVTDTGIDTTPPAEADPATVTLELRAERMGRTKGGRVYTIGVTCEDQGPATVDSSTATIEVRVPHDRRR